LTNINYPNIKSLIFSVLESVDFEDVKEFRKNFIFNAFNLFACIKGKINFLQMQRFSDKCEQYFRINFEEKFNFQKFNLTMIKERVNECIVAFDPGYIQKSGKKTFGLGMYWSGCAGRPKWGLDICGFAAVDIPNNTAFHLNAIQTPKIRENFPNLTLLQYYCRIIKENYLYFKELTGYMVADSYFAKSEVVQAVTSCGLHFISRLQDNAALFYLFKGEQKGGRGAPKKYDGKVNKNEPNMQHFSLILNTKELKIYRATVWCRAFERIINLSIAVFYNRDGKEIARKMYFSTDLTLDGVKLVSYYRSRFQIEFLYRDAKQYCGLEDCQARSQNKLNFHFNAALTTVNLAKMHRLDTRKTQSEPFSMADFKTLCNNRLLLDRFILTFAINTKLQKNQQKINELCKYGLIAA
jgi:hypothetical protein